MKYSTKKTRKSISKKSVLLAVLALIVAAGFIVVTTNRKPSAVSGPIPTIDAPETVQGSDNTATKTPPSNKPTSKSVNQTANSSELLTPYGSLVSNHRPGQNGSNFIESSQCITTPGAKCYIKFTQGEIVKTLPEKTADSNGSVFWDWDIKEAGLTSGNWTITAVATLGDQTQTTADQVVLEVQ